ARAANQFKARSLPDDNSVRPPRFGDSISMLLFIGIMVAIGLAHWLVYTALLWMMIKLQNMNYNLLGLLGSSLLASALDYIPVVGCYVGWAALVICLWKCTGADIAPDVLFTVGVAGALMFCVNLFAIG